MNAEWRTSRSFSWRFDNKGEISTSNLASPCTKDISRKRTTYIFLYYHPGLTCFMFHSWAQGKKQARQGWPRQLWVYIKRNEIFNTLQRARGNHSPTACTPVTFSTQAASNQYHPKACYFTLISIVTNSPESYQTKLAPLSTIPGLLGCPYGRAVAISKAIEQKKRSLFVLIGRKTLPSMTSQKGVMFPGPVLSRQKQFPSKENACHPHSTEPRWVFREVRKQQNLTSRIVRRLQGRSLSLKSKLD